MCPTNDSIEDMEHFLLLCPSFDVQRRHLLARNTVNPMCPTNDSIEDMEHFLLLCPSFDVQRRHLLAGVSVLLRQFVEINSLPNDVLVQILLYGDRNLSNEINKVFSN